jgi:hypothetical protein
MGLRECPPEVLFSGPQTMNEIQVEQVHTKSVGSASMQLRL